MRAGLRSSVRRTRTVRSSRRAWVWSLNARIVVQAQVGTPQRISYPTLLRLPQHRLRRHDVASSPNDWSGPSTSGLPTGRIKLPAKRRAPNRRGSAFWTPPTVLCTDTTGYFDTLANQVTYEHVFDHWAKCGRQTR